MLGGDTCFIKTILFLPPTSSHPLFPPACAAGHQDPLTDEGGEEAGLVGRAEQGRHRPRLRRCRAGQDGASCRPGPLRAVPGVGPGRPGGPGSDLRVGRHEPDSEGVQLQQVGDHALGEPAGGGTRALRPVGGRLSLQDGRQQAGRPRLRQARPPFLIIVQLLFFIIILF